MLGKIALWTGCLRTHHYIFGLLELTDHPIRTIGVGSWIPLTPLKMVPLRAAGDTSLPFHEDVRGARVSWVLVPSFISKRSPESAKSAWGALEEDVDVLVDSGLQVVGIRGELLGGFGTAVSFLLALKRVC